MKRFKLKRFLPGLFLALAACSAFGGAETSATLQAEMTEFVETSTAVVIAYQSRATEVMATAEAASTYVFNMEGINQQLAATLRAAIPPTQQIIERSGPVTPGFNAEPGQISALIATPLPGQDSLETNVNQFVDIATAARVRASDGCADGTTTRFSVNSDRVYITARMLNARAGASVYALWTYEGTPIYTSDSYTIPRDDPDFCIWFYVDQFDVDFIRGNWSARFFLDGAPIDPVANYIID